MEENENIYRHKKLVALRNALKPGAEQAARSEFVNRNADEIMAEARRKLHDRKRPRS